MDREIGVVIVDDHEMMLEGLRAGLDQQPHITVVATATSVADYRARCAGTTPCVAVVDFQLPDGTGLDIARMNRDADPPIPTIIISGLQRRGLVRDVMSAGCQGLLSKTVTIAQLVDAIGTVARGGNIYPPDALRAVLSGDLTEVGSTLTPREREILSMLADARKADEIAEQLDVSVNTVRNHIRSILSKMHATSQLEAVIIAQRAGLV